MILRDLPIDHEYKKTGQRFTMYPYLVSKENLISVSFGKSSLSARVNIKQFMQLLAVDAFDRLGFRVRVKSSDQEYPTAPPRLSPPKSKVIPGSPMAKELDRTLSIVMSSGFDRELLLILKKYDLDTELQKLIAKSSSGSAKAYQHHTIPVDERIGLQQEASEIDQELKGLSGHDVDVLAKRRIGQSKFRDTLIKKVQRCCISGLDNESLLIASHIVPWSQSNSNEKVDTDNGLLLSVTWDALFDKRLMYFNPDGTITFSKQLNMGAFKALGIGNNAKLEERFLTDKRKTFLAKHAEETLHKWQSK